MTGRWKQLIWILPLAMAGLVTVLGWWGDGRLRETIAQPGYGENSSGPETGWRQPSAGD